MTRKANTAGEVLFQQINIMQDAIDTLRRAIDDITSTTDPETATWPDVARYAHIIDGLKRAELAS